MQSQPHYQPSDKIGMHYQVHQALMGGMGEVYLCLDPDMPVPYALRTSQQRLSVCFCVLLWLFLCRRYRATFHNSATSARLAGPR